MNEILWRPNAKRMESSEMYAFMQFLEQSFDLNLYHYQDLYDWSVNSPADFWAAFASFTEIQFDVPPDEVMVQSEDFLHTRWFTGAKLNYAAHLLEYWDDNIAIASYDESGFVEDLTFAELHQAVAKVQMAMVTAGIQKGDVVAGLMPNVPETIIAMIATTALGAIWTSCSLDFGAEGIIDRFAQVKPKMLFTTAGYTFKGKWIDCTAKIKETQAALTSLYQTIWLEIKPRQKLSDKENLWSEWIRPDAKIVTFESVDFDHPAFILYSSGTTGMPKCIVHGHGGTLIQHLKELRLHTNLKRDDRLMYVTTCGWMMWNWMASGLAVGATLVLFEGSPVYPNPKSLFRTIKKAEITVFGTSAKYLSMLQHASVKDSSNAFASVHTILSTGSPLMPETFSYIYQSIKQDICVSSIAGGTDIISCFALGCPVLPVRSGELQCRGLGMAVEIWNQNGTAIVGEQGELVCVKPFPSIPVKFWDDPGDKKYLAAYFEKFPNVWTHGDYAMLTDNGGLVIFGRSDAVLNPGGVRIGTAEIYRQVEAIPGILESLAIGQNIKDTQRIILFVILEKNQTLDQELIKKIKARLREQASPRHVPEEIIQVKDFPRTVNGKVSEIAVSRVMNGHSIDNAHALINPQVLKHFEALARD